MPLRFNKRISLGKFLRLNISKSGVGVSVGPRGAHLTLGPGGTRVTVGLPGTGLSYTRKLDDTKVGSFSGSAVRRPGLPGSIREPGPFAPEYEKELVKGLNDLNSGQTEAALAHFLAAAPQEAAAAIYAAFSLARQPEGRTRAIELLEGVVGSDARLPTVLMQKYLGSATLPVEISSTVSADVPVDSAAAPLLLAELYQANGDVDQAIGLLDEIADLSTEPAITLSLCELLASKGLWEEIVERAKDTTPADDVTVETRIWYGRAMLEKNLPEAALGVLSQITRKKKGVSPLLQYEARYWRAMAYVKQGKQSQANAEFQKLYADAPEFRDVAQRVLA